MAVRLIRQLTFAALLLIVQACTSLPPQIIEERVPVPEPWYDWCPWITPGEFSGIEVAQSRLALGKGDERWWGKIGASTRPAGGCIAGLRKYHPMQARWKLKDGREFVLQHIDVEAILRNYFRANTMIRTQWQRENRQLYPGDSSLSLTHSIDGDTLSLKWVLAVNMTPITKRIAPSGAANLWLFETEVYPIISIKGTPTSGIDFGKYYESGK